MEFTSTHECDFLLEYGRGGAFKVELGDLGDGWFFRYQAFATESELVFSEADAVGEVMSDICLRVRFCPYCGKELL